MTPTIRGYTNMYSSTKFKISKKPNKPIFYKKPFFHSSAFYALAALTTIFAAGVFYYG